MAVYIPSSLEDALDILRDPECIIISGGTDYFPALKRSNGVKKLVSLISVPEIRGLRSERKGIRMGATLTWTQLIQSDLPPAFDALKTAGSQVGSVQIQNAATVVGNLCNASPAADGIPALLALNAEVELQSAMRGRRQVPLMEFVKGVRTTDRKSDEIVTSIFVPHPPQGMQSVFSKLGSREYLVISIAMTALNVVLDKSGRVKDMRVAVGACSTVAQRLSSLENEARGKLLSKIHLTPDHLAVLSPIDDVRASAIYRRDAVLEQIRQAFFELKS